MENEKSATYVCRFCKGSFSQPQDLYKHVQKIHTVSKSSRESRLCPLCGHQSQKLAHYQHHLRYIHGYKEDAQVFTFRCFNDFLIWKNELEKRNYCKYLPRPSPKGVQQDTIHLFQCDSSAQGLKEKKNKAKMTCEDVCPSVISAVEYDKSRQIRVEYWSTHKGHVVPLEDNELDAAISSLQTSEIVLNEDQNDADGNVFFIPESNDGSLSNSFGDETPKRKKSSLFLKNQGSAQQKTPKVGLQKFSYKKDTTKKVGSFQYSLASVACMKSIKKTSDSTFIPVINATSSAVSEDSIAVLSVTPGSDLASRNEMSDTKNNQSIFSSIKSQDVGVCMSNNNPSSKKSSLNVQSTPSNLTLINDGTSSGQLVILNTVPGDNSIQNLILCPAGASNLPSALTLGQNTPRQNQRTSTKDIQQNPIFITSSGELLSGKENASSLQNVTDMETNVDALSSGKSVLKKQTTGKVQSPKKVPISLASNLPSQKTSTSSQNLILSDKRTPKRNIKIAAKPPPTSLNDVKNISPNVQSFIAINSPVNANNSSKVAANNSLTTSIINPAPLNSLPAGQTFMSINNNLIPIVNTTQPFLTPNINSSFMVASAVTPSVTKGSQPLLALSPLASHPVLSSVTPNTETNKINTTTILPSMQNLSPNNSVPIIVLPSTAKVIGTQSTNNKSSGSVTTTSVLGSINTTAIPSNVHNLSSNNSVPLLLLPNTAKVISSAPTLNKSSGPVVTTSVLGTIKNPVVSIASGTSKIIPVTSPLKSPIVSSGLNKPLTSNVVQSPSILSRGQFLSSPVIQRGAHIISSSLLPSNAKFIPNSLLSSSMQSVGTSRLSNTLASSHIISNSAKPIISTTVSNKVQIRKVSMQPSSITSSTVTAQINSSLTTRPATSESNKVSTVVLNTEPISSTPAISIPPLPNMDNKSETFIFESEGNVYMLQSVENAEELNSDTSHSQHQDEISEKEVRKPDEKSNCTISIPEKKNETLEKTSTKEVTETDEEQLYIEDADWKEKTIESAEDIEKVDGKTKATSPMKVTEVRNGVQIKSVVQEKRPLREDDVEILKKVKYYQMEMKYLSSQAECKRLKLELVKTQMKNKALMKQEEKLNSSENLDKVIANKENMEDNKLESVKSIDIDTSKEVQSMDTHVERSKTDVQSEEKGLDTLEESSSEIIDSGAKMVKDILLEEPKKINMLCEEQIFKSILNETDSNNKRMVKDILKEGSKEMNMSSEKKILESIILNETENVDNSSDEQIENIILDDSMDVSDSSDGDMMDPMILDEEPVVDSNDNTEISKESLKKLEEQYGNVNSLDIYTMIRSSVLRSLYEDMKGLCEENKKLFEELQNYKAHDKLLKIFKEELQDAEL